MVVNGKVDGKKMQDKEFKDWIDKNRMFGSNITIDEYINDSGTTMLYNDGKYMLSRTDSVESTAIAAVPTELCLAFNNDKSIGFENPIGEFLEHFFLYPFHIIENCEMMYQTELLGVTPFKTIKEGKKDIRYWPPTQGHGVGGDLYYTNLEDCILKENMNKLFLNLPKEMWDIFYKDLKQQRK